MAPRAYWKGYLRLSLVSFAIQLFPATSEQQKIRLHLINKKTGHQIKYGKLDAITGEQVDAENAVMGYEVTKGQYVELTKDDLAAVAIDSTHTIEIDQFVPRNEIDDLYLKTPYYITPDGEVGRQAFAVIREAIKREGVVALGRVVLTTREHVIAIEPRNTGMLGMTLRYPYEVRSDQDYFSDLPNEKMPEAMLDLARHIVATKTGHFEPKKFQDHYESALKDLIKRKQHGEKIEKPKKRTPAEVTNLVDALRQSAAAAPASNRPEPTSERVRRASARHSSSARARKAS